MADKPLMPDTKCAPILSRFRRRRVWIGGAVALAVVFGLLVSSQFALQLSKKRGWTTRRAIRRVGALAVDEQGWVWVAHARNKITRLDPNSGETTSIPQNSRLASDSVFSLAIDGQGRMWVGTLSGAVHMRDVSGEWITYTPEHPENDNRVWDLAIDGIGRVWMRSNSGLGVIDPQQGATTYRFDNAGLGNGKVDALTTDEQGRVWVATDQGLHIFDSGIGWTTYNTCGLEPDDAQVTALAVDRQGRVWVGDLMGNVSVCGPDGAWTAQPIRGSIPGIIIPDKQGRVWVGFQGKGLSMFDPDIGWTTYSTDNSGLTDDRVDALAIDQQGRVWVGDPLSVLDTQAALPAQDIQTLTIVLAVVFPAALFSVALLALLVFAFTRPGALRTETIRDFGIGFICWFLIHTVFWWSYTLADNQLGELGIILVPVVFLPLPINIIALIILVRKRCWIALGALSAFTANSIGIILVAPSYQPQVLSPIFEIFTMTPFLRLLGST